METGIFYFSGTGNSLAAAKVLAARFETLSIFNIADIMRKDVVFASYERVIVVFPAYGYGMPLAVKRFLKTAVMRDVKYTAALVTHGSKQGGCLAEAKRLLKRRGIKLDYARGIPAVENFIPLFGSPSNKKLLDRTLMQGNAVEEIGNDIEAGVVRSVASFRPFSKLVSVIFRAARPLLVKFYRVEENCTGCGLCKKICPAQAIDMHDGKPAFCGDCEVCQCCINFCPQKAISFARVKPHTARYTNKNVKVSEFYIKNRRHAAQEQEELAAETVVETV